ncbi:MAG: hypothetical protein KDB21_16080 [Acidimicrobiales bacterium]|nr:hypothetical protein [Acidimicrobiales bacterium]
MAALQLYLIVGRTGDPHHRFGFQPFGRADVYSAEIVRVTADGERLPVDDGTWEYRWSALVAEPHLTHPFRPRWASDGADATLDLLDDALDWVAANTPDDTRTHYLEAVVTVIPNGRDPETVVLRSAQRDLASGDEG